MQYWCEKLFGGVGDGYGYDYGCDFDDTNGYEGGHGGRFSPAMLVTGVKLEEVVLNALLV